MMRKLILWSLTLLTAGVIFFFSSQSAAVSSAVSEEFTQGLLGSLLAFLKLTAEQQEIAHELIRSVAHIMLFALLGLFASLLVRCYTHKHWAIITALSCVGYALLDECHQLWFSAGRAFELADIAKDSFGVLLGMTLVVLWYRLRQQKKGT